MGQKCTNETLHAHIQLDIRVRFKKGDRVLYNYWAYEPDSPATVVGYCERGKPDGHSYPWAWIRLKFDHLKRPRTVPIHSKDGWHLTPAKTSSIPPPLVQAGDAVAADDRPAASANSALDQRLFSKQATSTGQDFSGPRVPNFQGETVRNVIERAAALGIPVEFTGSGIARAQFPEAGAILPSGQQVRVQFGR